MAAIKYDVSDVETGGGGEEPQPALYKGKVVSINNRKKKNDGTAISDLEVVCDIGEEYVRLWTYVKLPDDPNYDQSAHGWKLREFTDAMGLPPKGSIDPAKLKNKPVLVKVRADTDQDGEYKGKIKNLFKPGTLDEDAVTGGDDSQAGNDYSEWTDEDLKAELAERDLKVTGRFSSEKAIALLEEADGGGEEPEGEEPEGEAEVNLPEGYEDIAEWSDDDLKEELKSKDIKLSGRFSAQKARDAIIEAIAGTGQEEETPSEEDGPTDDYDEWETEELATEVSTRNEQGADIKVTGRKTKEKLIEALREDDKNAEPF